MAKKKTNSNSNVVSFNDIKDKAEDQKVRITFSKDKNHINVNMSKTDMIELVYLIAEGLNNLADDPKVWDQEIDSEQLKSIIINIFMSEFDVGFDDVIGSMIGSAIMASKLEESD